MHSLARWKYGWTLLTIYGQSHHHHFLHSLRFSSTESSFEPEAEKTCEEFLNLALQTIPDNPEALQALASVRMSQQRPDDAKRVLEQVWTKWKDLDLDDPALPPIPTRLSLVKLFLELSLYTPALLVLQGIMSTDDQEVEAWYLEGWCFFLMAENAKESGDGKLDDMTWEELAKDSRDCLETCKVVNRISYLTNTNDFTDLFRLAACQSRPC